MRYKHLQSAALGSRVLREFLSQQIERTAAVANVINDDVPASARSRCDFASPFRREMLLTVAGASKADSLPSLNPGVCRTELARPMGRSGL